VEGLRKAESSLAVQLRMGTNGLNALYFQARATPPSAAVAEDIKTAQHVLIFCPKYVGARHQQSDELGHFHDFSKLLGTAEGL
jgi:hypothetical protein